MDEIQDAVLNAISNCRDETVELFEITKNKKDLVHSTLNQLFIYQAERSVTISYLVSSNYWWDAEIIMRAFYETHAKILFICLASENERQKLVEEFWGDLTNLNSRKRAYRAEAGINLIKNQLDLQGLKVLDVFKNQKIFPINDGNKKNRKLLEQKWSFAEMINTIETNTNDSFPIEGISALKHIYGMQSHLIHADDTALDIMTDRRLRDPKELELLVASHVCRIWSDQISLWTFSTSALYKCFKLKSKSKTKRWKSWQNIQDLIEPIKEEFNQSQKEFYDNLK